MGGEHPATVRDSRTEQSYKIIPAILSNILLAARRFNLRKRINIFLLFMVAIIVVTAPRTSQAATNYTFTTIAVPGASGTAAQGINDAGQTVGYFSNSAGRHGFLYGGGSFTTIDVPGAAGAGGTVAGGINDAGQIVGYFYDSNNHLHGFLYSGGAFTTIDAPGAGSYDTVLTGINDAGQIVGTFTDAGGQEHGFLYIAGAFTVIDAPGVYVTNPNGINNAGQIVGTFFDSPSSCLTQCSHGFLYSGGVFTTIDAPSAGPTGSGTILFGINNLGQIVGAFYDNSDLTHGVLYGGGAFTTIDAPGETGTVLLSINKIGQIVGTYLGASFLATPPTPLPVAVNETATTSPGVPVTINLSAGASGNPTSAATVGTPVGGTVSIAGTTATFTPTTGFTGTASFQFTLANAGGTSNTATATITVLPPPVAVNETATTTVNTAVTIDLTVGASGSPTSAALVGTPVGGTVSITGTTATFTPTTGFTGTGSFQFTLSNAGGTSNTATATITVTASPPHIIFVVDLNPNKAVDATTVPQTVVVGQPISLYAGQVGTHFTPPTGQTQEWWLNGKTWPITGQVTVGGFVKSDSCPQNLITPPPQVPPTCTGTVTPLPAFTNSSTPTFYWTVPGTFRVTYRYTLNGGGFGATEASFNVEGPKANSSGGQTINASPPGNLYEGIDQKTGSPSLAFPLITFTQKVLSPPGYNGNYTWVQTLYAATVEQYDTIFSRTPAKICVAGYYYPATFPYLDNTYPYYFVNKQQQAYDSPDYDLGSTYNRLTWQFEARTYLMWTADAIQGFEKQNIAVPLGYIDWGFSGGISKVFGRWGFPPPSTVSKYARFVQGPNYPTWRSVAINGTEICNK